jgi:hypothetical protein
MLTGLYDLAICNDGDADRLGILDEHGDFVSPHKIISLLVLYLVREKKLAGEIVKTFSTTRLIERVAQSLGATLHETPIGFKYVADLMLSRDVLVGGEESGGIGIGAFMPERDGIPLRPPRRRGSRPLRPPLSQIIARMEENSAPLHYDRRDLHRPMEQCARLIDRVRSGDSTARSDSPRLERRKRRRKNELRRRHLAPLPQIRERNPSFGFTAKVRSRSCGRYWIVRSWNWDLRSAPRSA